MNTPTKNIWTTVECAAWVRGFDYSEYLFLHASREEVGVVLSAEGYNAIYTFFEDELGRG